MLVLTFTLQNHLKKIESALIDTIDDFKKNPHSPCSFNRLRESRIYWAAHVNLVRSLKRIIYEIQSRRKKIKHKHIERDQNPKNLLDEEFQMRHKM